MKHFLTYFIDFLLQRASLAPSYDKARKYALFALRLAKRYKKQTMYADIYFFLGHIYYAYEKYLYAVIALSLAQRYAKENVEKLRIVSLLIDVLSTNEQHHKARKIAVCSLRETKEIYSDELYLRLSEVYKDLGNHHKAILYAKKCLRIAAAKEDEEATEVALHQLIDLYRLAKEYPMAIELYENASTFGISNQSSHMLVSLFEVLKSQGEYNKAKELIPDIEQKLASEKDALLLPVFYGEVLEVYKKLKDKEGFEHYFEKYKTLQNSKQSNYVNWLIYSQVADFYKIIHQPQLAIHYYKEMAHSLEKVRTSSLNREALDRVAFFKDKYYYLLEAIVFLFDQREYALALYFLEGSKSASLRDIYAPQSLEIIRYEVIKEYM